MRCGHIHMAMGGEMIRKETGGPVRKITKHDFPELRWRGHWISWPIRKTNEATEDPSVAEREEVHLLFRRSFNWQKTSEGVPTRITADSRYILYANEKEVFRGPIRSQPHRLHYDLFDLAPYLEEGRNTLAVCVKYYGIPRSWWMPAMYNTELGRSAVMVFEAHLGEGNWLVSDEAWKVLKSDAWTELRSAHSVRSGLPIEILDARKLPCNWNSRDYDDLEWMNAARVPALNMLSAHVEFCQLKEIPSGGLAHTQPPSYPYGPLFPRPIPKLGGEIKRPRSVKVEYIEKDVLGEHDDPVIQCLESLGRDPIEWTEPEQGLPKPVVIPQGGYVRCLIDMGSIVAGIVQLDMVAPAGAVVDMAFMEDCTALDPLNPTTMYCGARYTARGHQDVFRPFDTKGFRYVIVLIRKASGPVALTSFFTEEQLFPWSADAYFECSDEVLNAIYKAGIRTVSLNSQDAMLDCPTREQRSFTGDSVVEILVHLTNNPDWSLAAQQVVLGNSPRSDGLLPISVASELEHFRVMTIPDWGLHWVHSVYLLHLFMGDKELVGEMMPTIERLLQWYAQYQGSNGLLSDVPEWNLIDWSFVMVEDTSSCINALWARGLKEYAEMAAWLDDRNREEWARRLYEKIRIAFEVFWDESKGSYVDHVKDGVPQKAMSQLAGALAICAGLAPQERLARILERITDVERLVDRPWMGDQEGRIDPQKVRRIIEGTYQPDWDLEKDVVLAQPFMQYVVHDAVAMAGRADLMPELYRRWARYLETGYDTIGELWTGGTNCHGWSCTTARDVMFYTLGVQPAVPGYGVARIAPRLGKLEWARGSVPTPNGFIKVEVDRLSLAIESPIPFILDLEGQPVEELDRGSHRISL